MSTPPGEWLTIGEAAARLGCSSRTISRRIAGGEMQINDGPDGRRVLLTVPDRVAATVSALREEGDRQIQLAGAAVSAACHAQEQAEKAADLARGDLRRSQQWGTGLALALFVILSAGGVGVGLGAWRISGQRADLVNIATLSHTSARQRRQSAVASRHYVRLLSETCMSGMANGGAPLARW